MDEDISNPSRRRLLGLAVALPPLWLVGCGPANGNDEQPVSLESLELSDSRWREILSVEEYRVLRREGTERAFSSPLDKEYGDGTYVCAGCFLPLFSGAHKFDSRTGWPSFWRPIDERHVGTKRDFKMIWPRTEYHCARCGGHQGHIFDDGPRPTGQRWCNNGVALRFIAKGQPLPELRAA